MESRRVFFVAQFVYYVVSILQHLNPKNSQTLGVFIEVHKYTRWAPTSYKCGYNSTCGGL